MGLSGPIGVRPADLLHWAQDALLPSRRTKPSVDNFNLTSISSTSHEQMAVGHGLSALRIDGVDHQVSAVEISVRSSPVLL